MSMWHLCAWYDISRIIEKKHIKLLKLQKYQLIPSEKPNIYLLFTIQLTLLVKF